MKAFPALLLVAGLLVPTACTGGAGGQEVTKPETGGTLAQVYYWRAKPGKFDEYTRYIREHAEPIDAEARKQGAFISVTTFMTRDTLSPWSHMRVFVLQDSVQLEGLSAALSAAGILLEPDSAIRRQNGDYSATLRDAAGSATLEILR
jgi:hypothetical protein